MVSVNRRLVGLALGSALALGGTVAVPAATAAPAGAPSACGHLLSNSYIYERWSDLGGVNGMLGCPRTDVLTVKSANGTKLGKRQYFDSGNVTFSPRQGQEMVVAAWERNGYAYFNWGPTDPYHYDVFLVRYTSAADAGGTQVTLRGGTTGGMWVRKHTSGTYSFKVEGCDKGRFGLKCRQGWTLEATTRN
ncbi:hypothetical protein [Streptomyces sp. NBC_00827]|uniref:hypothetical protein n=1 Tax=Streptomyces sp. NBC_00827 TaxID=2903677 RepID=UPI00386C72EF|nr:hypothetical protein OG569_31980 [Streptomyces sp. NBC_00827]